MHTTKCFQNHLGPWLIESNWFTAAVAAIKSGTWKAEGEREIKPQAVAEGWKLITHNGHPAGDVLYAVNPAGVAVMEINGPMMKAQSKFGGCSTMLVRQALRTSVSDKQVGSIMLNIESPGGTTAGIAELAHEIRETNQQKPVHAHFTDIGASAAVWAGVQARRVTANAMALVGSIGVYAVLVDDSKQMEMAGIKLHLISSGAQKGAGADGVVTEEMKSDTQKHVDAINDVFLSEIALGRNMTPKQVRELATGQVWMASEAKKLGLIDGVMSFDHALAALSAKTKLPADRPRAARAAAQMKIAEMN